MPKKTRIAIKISLPEGHGVDRATLENGTVRLYDATGQEVLPAEVERVTEYERAKGPKVQARLGKSIGTATVGGLHLLSGFDHFIVIDANTAQVHGLKMTAAFFIACKLESSSNGYELKSLDQCGHVYEFHDVPGNPEMFAIRRIANDILRTHPLPPGAAVAFITDSDLGRHDAINTQAAPLYGSDLLPSQFKLIYASSDTGSELVNRLIRFCDKRSTVYIKKARKNGVSLAGVYASPEAPEIAYRCTYFPGLSITNPVVTDVAFTDETTISMAVS